ncbi:MAG: SDR family oxidoreductase [Parcubacteria group bacterium]|nr:SDR family oxidoreductase [Parcubacteria group bacterium]
MNTQNKNAVVVGATGNLGGAIAKTLTHAGYSVHPTWLTEDHPDATKEESYQDLPNTIHVAIYCPGANIVKETESLSLDEWNHVLAVNLTGAFLFARAAFPRMKKAGHSTFITISSINVTHPYPRRVAYVASKAGLEGLTRELAVEWGQFGIATHCIRLGHLSKFMKATPPNPEFLKAVSQKIPSGRFIEPEDVASYVIWLAEGGAKAVSGSVIDFDPAYMINRNPLI